MSELSRINACMLLMSCRYLDVYSIILPSSASNLKATTYTTEYSFLLREGGVFHRVSLHNSFMAASIIHPRQSEDGLSAQILIVNWKYKQQLTISPRFDNVCLTCFSLGVIRLTDAYR